jgi:uncharacterized protein (TIGR00251 family)
MPSWYRWDKTDLVLQLHVQPRASSEGLVGVTEQGLKVRLTTPPVDGRANQALQHLLSREFAVSKADIVIERGISGRHKQVRIRSPRRLPVQIPAIKGLA